MVYKVVLRFSPNQDGGLLMENGWNNYEDGIHTVFLHGWNNDRKTRNLSVAWRPTKLSLVTLKFGKCEDDSPLSFQGKFHEFSKDGHRRVLFLDLPMHEYKGFDMIFAVIEVLHFQNVLQKVQQSLKKPPKENSVQPITLTRAEQLGAIMNKLFETGEFSDVTLSDGTTDIKAHKLILSVHSPVFAKMFQNAMKENLENRVVIEDIPIDVLKTLINFMYSEEIEVSDRAMVRELYIASEKYDIKSLREICSDALKSMDITNVIDTLLLSDLHSNKTLKKAALDFVTKHFSELKVLEEWDNFLKENQTLYLEALSYVVDKKV